MGPNYLEYSPLHADILTITLANGTLLFGVFTASITTGVQKK